MLVRPAHLGGVKNEVSFKDSKNPIPRIPASLTTSIGTVAVPGIKYVNSTYRTRSHIHPVALDFSYKSEIKIGRDYELSLEYRASPMVRYRPELGVRVEVINGFVIYRLKGGPIEVDEARRYEINSFPVIKNPNNQMIGLLTGRVIIKSLEPSFDAQASIGGVMIYEAKHLGVTYLKLPEGEDLISRYEELQETPGVDRADLEILQGGVVPR